jgi:hypothetical protein
MCTCRIECEEISLADGSTVFVCVTCETWAETSDGRLVAMATRRVARRPPGRARRKARRLATR